MLKPEFYVGQVPVGRGLKPIFLAEIGAMFNQDVALAHELISRIALAANASVLKVVLKGEILHDPEICINDASFETFQSKHGVRKRERFRDLIERKCLSLGTYSTLISSIKETGLPSCFSVYDFTGADFVRDHGVDLIKIASSNLTHLPLIRHVAKFGIPILIDTGRATLAEVDRAVRTARDAGVQNLILEHSQDGHPSPPENHNMRALQTLRTCFDVPVGLSDHARGETAMHVAIGLGVELIERNVVADEHALEQDVAFSTSIAEIPRLLSELHDSAISLGRTFRDINNKNGLIATSARMGLVTRRPVTQGELISDETTTYAFPNYGIGVENIDLVTGWQFSGNLPAGHSIDWTHIARR
jgi:sialic acid synthase SpsE